jgi:hypothetical protein
MNDQPSPDSASGGPRQRRRRRPHAGRAIRSRVAAGLLSCLTVAPAAAEDWDFSISPYFWAAGIQGKTSTLPGLPAADIDMSFGDIFDDLKPSGMVFFNANKGRLGFAADLQYVETEAKTSALQPLFNRERLRSTSLVFSALVNYLVLDDDRVSLRLGGGARLWSVDTDLKLATGLLPGRRRSHEETWVDPILGGGGVVNLSPKVFARGWAYVGGFGVGSDLTADLFAGFGYRITDSISSTLGYRWVKVDYDNDDFLYDVRQEGLATGITFRF